VTAQLAGGSQTATRSAFKLVNETSKCCFYAAALLLQLTMWLMVPQVLVVL
jgi:hypothetical protein